MKKIIFLIFVFFLSLHGYSQFTEGFEDTTGPDLVTDQWDLGSTGLGSNGIWGVFDNGVGTVQNWMTNSGAGNVYEGLNAAYVNREFVGAGNTSRDYLATPRITIPANGQLRFFTRTTVVSDNGTIYKIMVSTSPVQNDPSAYTLVTQFTELELNAVYNIYEEKVVDLDAYAGQEVYVAFVMENTQETGGLEGDRWLVDNVRVVPQCVNPTNLTAGSISQTSATLGWANPSGATQFEVEVVPFGQTPTGNGTIVTGTSYVATTTVPGGVPFTPTTQYDFYVQAICAENVTSQWVGPFTFSTQSPGLTCASPIIIGSTPYSTTDSTANYGDTTDATQPAGCGATGNFMTGNDVFYSYTPATSGAISIQMTPTGTWSGIFVYQGCANVGVSCLAGVGNSSTGIRDIPSLAVTAGQEYIIVISTNASPQTVDYTLVIQTLNCAPPTALSANGTGPNSANLSWNGGTATSWEVFVQTAGSPVPATAGQTATTSTNFGVTTLTGTSTQLVLGTSYQYWVRSDCGDGTFSPWAGPYVFNTTACSLGCNVTFTMTDTFGDGWNGNTMNVIQDGFTIATIGGNFTEGEGPIIVSVPLCNGPFQLFWNAGGAFAGEVGVTVTNSFGQVIYVKDPGEGAQNSLLFEGTVDCSAPLCLPPSNLQVSNITTFGATLTWTPTPGQTVTSWEIYAIPSNLPPPLPTDTPTATATGSPFTIGGLLADTEYTYYVRAICSGGGTNPWSAASPDFTTLPTCPKPTALTATLITQTTASLQWTNGSGEASWQVLVLPAGSPAPTAGSTGWVTAGTNPFVVTNLTSGTSYDYYVRAVCSDSDISTWAGPYNFNTTVCDPVNQCLYTFTMTDTFGDGWNGNTMSIIQNGVTVATIGSTFTTGVGPVIVQVPLCHGVAFSLVWNTGGAFANEVGVSITSFLGENIFTYTPGTGTQGTTLYSGTGECIAPTCVKPTNVTVTAIGLTTASVSWVENNSPNASSWDIIVLPANAPAPLPTATGWTNVTTNPYILTGLTAATNYKVYVRSVCSSTDSSFWSTGAQFNTQICAPSNLCEYTFVMVDSFGDSWNGNTMNISQNGILVATLTGPTNADDTNPVSQTVSLCNGIPFQLFWNSGGAFANEVGVSIVNSTGQTIYVKNPGSGSQNTQLFSGTVTCIPVTCPKPVQVVATSITQTSASISWTEAGSATAWEIWVLPFGSPAPTSAGIATNNPYLVTGLTAGTAYTVYVRAICSATDVSNWSTVYNFATPPINDECANAIFAPVNQDLSCVQTVSGTIIGATGSNPAPACPGAANDDVWFSFTALASAHIISFNNSAAQLSYGVYSGGCSGLTQVACADENSETITGLTVGTTYFIRVYSTAATPVFVNNFNLCISTVPCATATPFCTGQVLTYPNATGILPGLGSLGCLGSSPNPAFFFLQVNNAGQLNYLMTQSTTPGGAPNLDVDYALWGPFTDNAAACAVIPNDNPLSCSYSAAPTENFSIANAQLCQIYVVMITNFSDDPGFITFQQTNTTGGGTTICYPYNTFNYSANSYCQNAANPTPILVAGAVAGTYTSSSPGLVIDSVTGVINLAASTPGNYIVTSTTVPTTGGICPSIPNITTIRSVTITAVPDAAVSYGTTPYCNSIDTAQAVTLTGTSGGTYSSSSGLFINAVNGNIIPGLSTPGIYTVTYTIAASGGCPAFTTTTQVEIIQAPAIPFINNVNACDSYTLPALAVGNYYIEPNGDGQMMNADDVIYDSMTLYVFAENAVCSDERSFTITINETPQLAEVDDVIVCDNYTLPILTEGDYYTATGGPTGTGALIPDETVISTTQNIYIYQANGTCSDEEMFTVTVTGAGGANADDFADVIRCDSYTLPTLSANNTFYASSGGPNGGGSVIDPLVPVTTP
ncbi:MAG TPA: fibronectin type III domain-containing protein, partial [Flavobacterium sp.]